MFYSCGTFLLICWYSYFFGESWGAKGLKTWQLRVKTPTRWCLFNVTLEILTWKPIKCQFRRKKWMRIIKEHIPMALLLCGEVTFASRLVGEARAPPCLRLSPAPQVPHFPMSSVPSVVKCLCKWSCCASEPPPHFWILRVPSFMINPPFSGSRWVSATDRVSWILQGSDSWSLADRTKTRRRSSSTRADRRRCSAHEILVFSGC